MLQSSTILKVALQALVPRGVELRDKVSALFSTALTQRSYPSEWLSDEMLVVSAWNVMTALPTQMPDMRVSLHLPDICCSVFHTSEHVDWDRLQTKDFRNECFTLHVTQRALAQGLLNDIKFSIVG
jgi:hypothetical protein